MPNNHKTKWQVPRRPVSIDLLVNVNVHEQFVFSALSCAGSSSALEIVPGYLCPLPPSRTCDSDTHYRRHPLLEKKSGLQRFCCVLVLLTSFHGLFVAPASQRWTLLPAWHRATAGSARAGHEVAIEPHCCSNHTTALLQSWRRRQVSAMAMAGQGSGHVHVLCDCGKNPLPWQWCNDCGNTKGRFELADGSQRAPLDR